MGTVDPVVEQHRPLPVEIIGPTWVARPARRIGRCFNQIANAAGLLPQQLTNDTPQRQRIHLQALIFTGAFASTATAATDASTAFRIPNGHTTIPHFGGGRLWLGNVTIVEVLTEVAET